MTVSMYSIKDELNGFIPPISLPNDESAKRYFREMCEHNSTMKSSPNDFSIWFLCKWDTETGSMITDEPITLLERG